MPKLIDIDPLASPIVCNGCGAVVPPEQVFVSNPRPGRTKGTIYRKCLSCIRADSRSRDRAKRQPNRTYTLKHEKEALASKGLRRCSTCKQDKPFAEFNRQSDKIGGLQARCRVCDLSAKLGVPAAHYESVIRRFTKCQICFREDNLCVDHDHRAPRMKAVRGVLCRDCNKAIGRLGDSLEAVAQALKYLLVWARKKSKLLAKANSQSPASRKRAPMVGLKRSRQLLAKGRKRCPQCEAIKPVSQFDSKPSTRCGFNSWCKWCTRAIHEGIDPIAYAEAKSIKQCQICGATKSLHIDHDHSLAPPAPVRGVLCSNCNTAIGMLQESPDRLQRAAKYLSAWDRSKRTRRGPKKA